MGKLQALLKEHASLTSYADHLSFLAGDLSNRNYYRLKKERESQVLMHAPPPENPHLFSTIAHYLRDLGLSTPEVLQTSLPEEFLLLEDFGDQSFMSLLKKGENPQTLYALAIDALIHLHKTVSEQPPFAPSYTKKALMKETLLFLEWYCPEAQIRLSSSQEAHFTALWDDLYEKALSQTPHTFVLRDYHVDNLMFLPERSGVQACGLLDFQDAVWGPIVYDVVSLLEDARIDVSPEIETLGWKRYLAAFPHLDVCAIQEAAKILSLGRHLKILGIFARANQRYGKSQHLKHIPRVKRLVERLLPDFPSFFEFLRRV